MKPSSNGSAQVIRRLRAVVSGHDQGISAQIFRGASSTAALKVLNTGLMFVTAILLARFLGVEEYGAFAYAMSWVTLLGVFAGLGLAPVIVADVAVYHQKSDWAHIRGILRFSLAAVAAAGILSALAMAGAAWLMHRDDQALYTALLIACLLLPLKGLLLPLGATQNGLHQVTFAQIPTLLVMPAAFLVLIGAAFSLKLVEPSSRSAMTLQLLAVSVALLFAVLLLRNGLAAAGRPRRLPRPLFEGRTWIAGGLPMILMGSMFMVNSNADILMLGALAGPEKAGIYKAAARGAELLTFGLVIVSVPLGPVVASLYAAGDTERLQLELVRWARVAFAPTLVLGAVFLFKGEWFLRLFGADFVTDEARAALAILTLGQLVHAGAGPVGLLLIMTGRRTATAWVMTIAALSNVALNAVLIPSFGVLGAAIATASTTAFFALLLVRYTVRHMRLHTTVLSLLPAFGR